MRSNIILGLNFKNKMSGPREPLAVGYTIKLTPELLEILKLHIPESDHGFISSDVHVAVWFAFKSNRWNERIPPPGITKENCKPCSFLQGWYARKKEQSCKTYLRSMYVSKKKTLVVATVNCDSELVYAILYNKNNISTSPIKKAIGSGNLAAQNLEAIDLSGYDRIVLDSEPYLYCS